MTKKILTTPIKDEDLADIKAGGDAANLLI